MRTRSSSNLSGESSPNPSSSNPKRRNRRRSKKPFILEESPVDTMADQRTMAELLRAPTEGYAEAIVVPSILAEQFEFKHSLINMMTSDQFYGLEKDNPHDHIRWAARHWLEKEPSRSILTWEDLVSKFINKFFPPSRTTNLCNEISNFQQRFDESFHEAWDRYKDLLCACPHHGFTELHQLDTIYNALNPADQDSLNSAIGGNFWKDVLKIDANSSSLSEIAKLTHAVNQQTSAVITAMTAILKQFQATPPPAFVKNVEEICVTCGGAHPYYQCLVADGNTFPKLQDNIQGYVSAAATNYNQNMMASFFQMNTASTSGSGPLPSNTIAKPKGELNAITTRSGIVFYGPSVPMPPPFINPKEDERVDETLIDPKLDEFTLKVPPSIVQKPKHPSQRNLHINITLADALILISKYQKMLKALLSNKEKLLELANTPLNENCLAIILKKLPEKLGDHGKFLTLCGFSELKCKALADLEIEYFLNHDPIKEIDSILEDSVDEDNLVNLNDDLVDTIPEMFTNEHALDYSSHPLYDEYDDDLFEVESDTEYVYDDPFDYNEDEIKESKLLIDELDPLRSSDFLPSPEYDSFLFEDFFKVDALPSTNNEDKVFNLGILIQVNLFEVITHVAPDKNVKKIAIYHTSLILEYFDHPLYELPFHKEVPRSKTLLSFSSKNEKKVFNPGILTSKGVHSSLLSELSHRCLKVFNVIKILEIPIEIFPCFFGEDIRIPRILKTRARAFVLRSPDRHILSFILGIQYPNLID
nr:hypothetical protein [Tanacetum cinerariifolium]